MHVVLRGATWSPSCPCSKCGGLPDQASTSSHAAGMHQGKGTIMSSLGGFTLSHSRRLASHRASAQQQQQQQQQCDAAQLQQQQLHGCYEHRHHQQKQQKHQQEEQCRDRQVKDVLLHPGGPGWRPPLAPGGSGGGGGGWAWLQAAAVAPVITLSPEPRFRFWIDESLWSQGRTAVHLIESVLEEAGGVKTGGPSRGSGRRELGSHHVDQWEFLWSKSTFALASARLLRPGQAISAVVGLNCLTMKKRMQQTLKARYGEAAFQQLMPLSFALPEELEEWRAWVKAHRTQEAGLWMLKTGQDAGKGLRLLTTQKALEVAAAEAQGGSTKSEGKRAHHSHELKLAQVYMTKPLLLLSRKWHLRLWLLVTHHNPIRAYLHRRGLVLFSSEPYQDPKKGLASGGNVAASQVTNLARNSSGIVWTLQQLKRHFWQMERQGQGQRQAQQQGRQGQGQQRQGREQRQGESQEQGQQGQVQGQGQQGQQGQSHADQEEEQSGEGSVAFERLWSAMTQSCASALAASADVLKDGHVWLKPAIPSYGFQLLGVDFLVDQDMKPWLMEFNSSPSIMVEHDDAETAKMIYKEKHAMLRDLVSIVAPRLWRPSPDPCDGSVRAGGQRGDVEDGPAGEFLPLTPLVHSLLHGRQ